MNEGHHLCHSEWGSACPNLKEMVIHTAFWVDLVAFMAAYDQKASKNVQL